MKLFKQRARKRSVKAYWHNQVKGKIFDLAKTVYYARVDFYN